MQTDVSPDKVGTFTPPKLTEEYFQTLSNTMAPTVTGVEMHSEDICRKSGVPALAKKFLTLSKMFEEMLPALEVTESPKTRIPGAGEGCSPVILQHTASQTYK